MSKKHTISDTEATAFTIDGIGVELWWEAGVSGQYDKAVSTCRFLQKVPEMVEVLKELRTAVSFLESVDERTAKANVKANQLLNGIDND